mmetsp:Transcript_4514/g.10178  ORF Transcript_4514/g.10178 Transcript_4514/m.10178 type:complete len:89 (-) Transcript_4514:208-474(-)
MSIEQRAPYYAMVALGRAPGVDRTRAAFVRTAAKPSEEKAAADAGAAAASNGVMFGAHTSDKHLTVTFESTAADMPALEEVPADTGVP